jgi:cytochrome b561
MKIGARLSHYALYVLMIAMPLLGPTMQWAGAYPIVHYGDMRLPTLLPQSDAMHTPLWDAHFCLAFALFAVILLHVAAALFHALVR